nr:pitrilysin family protein [Kofleriaceae bacterium]
MTSPAAPQHLAFPDEEFRRVPPIGGAPRPFALPHMQRFELANGLEAFLVEQHALPIVSMDLGFDGGDRAAPDRPGLVGACVAMLTEGTDRLDKLAYSEALAEIGSSVTAYGGDDAHGVMLSSLTRHLDATFELFAATLRAPGLRERDLDRMIKRRIESVRQVRGSPQQISPRVAAPVLYGHDHPYGAVTTEASLAAITIADCRAFADAWLRPRGARLFVVGDLTEDQLRARFERGPLADWAGALPALAPLPALPATPPPRTIYFVHAAGAAQSQVSLLAFGPLRTAPDYHATSMLAAILGGGFASRINMNLREDKGYAYGARGGFSYTRDYGVFSASAGVQAQATHQALVELRREVDAVATGALPVTGGELAREATGAMLALPGRFATAQAALGQYRNLVYYGLPLDYYDDYAARIAAVTVDDVAHAAARDLPRGDAAVHVVVGDGAALQIARDGKRDVPTGRTLRAALAELGNVVELDADGRKVV